MHPLIECSITYHGGVSSRQQLPKKKIYSHVFVYTTCMCVNITFNVWTMFDYNKQCWFLPHFNAVSSERIWTEQNVTCFCITAGFELVRKLGETQYWPPCWQPFNLETNVRMIYDWRVPLIFIWRVMIKSLYRPITGNGLVLRFVVRLIIQVTFLLIIFSIHN